jgi:pimeloyl-ACP methyl ester carboxylesterase
MSGSQATSGFLDVNGARLYYEIAGAGEPLVLLHAGVANLRMWDAQVPAFAERYHVIRFDQRGYGRSEARPGEPWAMHEDLHGVMDALGVERAALLGCSMGGQAIVDFALAYPGRARALIPVGPGMSGYAWGSEQMKQVGEALEAAVARGDVEGATEIATHLWIDGPTRPSERVNPAMRARARAWLFELFSKSEETEPTAIEPPAIGRLGEISVPTLIILGENDVDDIQRVCHLLADGIPGAQLEVIADAAHVPNMDHPEQFNRLVLEFLAGV